MHKLLAGYVVALALGAGGVLAQDADVLLPCFDRGGNGASIAAGFEAAGWDRVTDTEARLDVAHSVGEGLHAVQTLSSLPRDTDEARALVQRMHLSLERTVEFPQILTFVRGDLRAYVQPAQDPLVYPSFVNCIIAGPSLTQVIDILDAAPDTITGYGNTLLAFRAAQIPVPEGWGLHLVDRANPRIDAIEITFDGPPDAPILAPYSLSTTYQVEAK